MPSETIYDHPRYYDVLFGFDRSQEAAFYHRIFPRCGVATCPEFAIESWHPESSRATGVSEFNVDPGPREAVTGRTMVVLRRQ